MKLTLVPPVDNALGDFQLEFEFTVRVAELDPGTLAQFHSPVLSISASASRATQLEVLDDFLTRCATHQRSMGATEVRLMAVAE